MNRFLGGLKNSSFFFRKYFYTWTIAYWLSFSFLTKYFVNFIIFKLLINLLYFFEIQNFSVLLNFFALVCFIFFCLFYFLHYFFYLFFFLSFKLFKFIFFFLNLSFFYFLELILFFWCFKNFFILSLIGFIRFSAYRFSNFSTFIFFSISLFLSLCLDILVFLNFLVIVFCTTLSQFIIVFSNIVTFIFGLIFNPPFSFNISIDILIILFFFIFFNFILPIFINQLIIRNYHLAWFFYFAFKDFIAKLIFFKPKQFSNLSFKLASFYGNRLILQIKL